MLSVTKTDFFSKMQFCLVNIAILHYFIIVLLTNSQKFCNLFNEMDNIQRIIE